MKKTNSIHGAVMVCIISVTLIFNSFYSFAQAPSWTWAHGSSSPLGWSHAGGQSITTDRFGNEYVTGYFESSTLVLGHDTLHNPGFANVYLAKYNQAGNLLWAKSPSGTLYSAEGYSVTTDAWGNIFLAGYLEQGSMIFGTDTLRDDSTAPTTFLAKFDSSGNIKWMRKAIGNSTVCGAYSVAADPSGNAVVTGMFTSPTITFGGYTLTNDTIGYYSSLFVVKYDSSGNVLWALSPRCLTGALWSVCTDASGIIYLAGVFSSNTISFGGITLVNDTLDANRGEICLAKLDPSGTVIWMKTAQDKGNDYLTGVACDPLGNVYVTGNYTGDSIRFGTQLLVADSPGVYNFKMFLTKYEATGIALWARGAIPCYSISEGVASDLAGNAYITGYNSSSPIIFGSDTLHSTGLFVVKYNGAGSSLWAFGDSIPTGSSSSIAVDGPGSVYLTGSFSGSECIFGTDTLHRSTGGVFDLFVAKLSSPTLDMPEMSNDPGNGIVVFPVPNDGEMNVYLNGTGYETITLRDAMGRVVYTQHVDASATDLKMTIKLGRVANGIYLLSAVGKNGVVNRRILVMQ